MRVRLFPSLLVLAAVVPVASARGGDGDFGDGAQTIALLPLGADDRARGEQLALLALLAEELEQRSDLVVLKPSEVRGVFDGAKPPDAELRGRLDGVRQLLDKARKHYQFLEVDKAQQKLDEAESRLAAVRDQLDSPRILIEFHLMKALVALLRGERDAAVDAFAQAFAIDSSFEITEEEYPPDVVETYREARERVEGAARGVVNISSSPEGSLVFINGVRYGRTPARLELPPGRHLARLQHRGCPSETLDLTVRAGRTTERRVVLDLQWDEDELDQLDSIGDPTRASRGVRKDLAGFAKRLGATFVLLGAKNPDEPGSAAWLFSVEGARFWTRSWKFSGSGGMFDEGELSRASRDVAMALVAGLPAAEERVPTERVVERPPEPGSSFGPTADEIEEGRAWYKTWWFWTITGVVVAGTTAGVTAWAVTRDEPSQTATILVEGKGTP